jgi:hypothetical protein
VSDAAIIKLSSLNEPRKEKAKKSNRDTNSKPVKKLIVHPKVKQQQQQQLLHPRILTLMRILSTYMATVCLLPQFQFLAAGPDRWMS